MSTMICLKLQVERFCCNKFAKMLLRRGMQTVLIGVMSLGLLHAVQASSESVCGVQTLIGLGNERRCYLCSEVTWRFQPCDMTLIFAYQT